jgi:hypothetical protein
LKIAHSRTIAVVDSSTPEFSPPMTPATTRARAESAITRVRPERARSLPSSVVIFSPSCRAAHDEAPAGDLARVKRVERLPVLEHHVVADVDDVVDRAQAHGAQALLHPRGAGADPHAGHDVGRVERAVLGAVDADAGEEVRSALAAHVAAELLLGYLRSFRNHAASSRAMPRCERQSGRLGVTSMSTRCRPAAARR